MRDISWNVEPVYPDRFSYPYPLSVQLLLPGVAASHDAQTADHHLTRRVRRRAPRRASEDRRHRQDRPGVDAPAIGEAAARAHAALHAARTQPDRRREGAGRRRAHRGQELRGERRAIRRLVEGARLRLPPPRAAPLRAAWASSIARRGGSGSPPRSRTTAASSIRSGPPALAP